MTVDATRMGNKTSEIRKHGFVPAAAGESAADRLVLASSVDFTRTANKRDERAESALAGTINETLRDERDEKRSESEKSEKTKRARSRERERGKWKGFGFRWHCTWPARHSNDD